MIERRKYERYDVKSSVDDQAEVACIVAGVPVLLINYSLGGVFVHSKKHFHVGKLVDISINVAHRGEIDLMGKVTREHSAERKWGVAIDFWILEDDMS